MQAPGTKVHSHLVMPGPSMICSLAFLPLFSNGHISVKNIPFKYEITASLLFAQAQLHISRRGLNRPPMIWRLTLPLTALSCSILVSVSSLARAIKDGPTKNSTFNMKSIVSSGVHVSDRNRGFLSNSMCDVGKGYVVVKNLARIYIRHQIVNVELRLLQLLPVLVEP